MAVLSYAEVDLGESVQSAGPPAVDQHRDLDAVASAEWDLLEQVAAGGRLARERLLEDGELGRV